LELSSAERELIARQGQASNAVVPDLRKVIELVTTDQLDAAVTLLMNKAAPGQKKVFSLLQELVAEEEKLYQDYLARGRQAYRETRRLMTMTGLFAFLISAIIALLMLKRTIKAETSLINEKELAEITLQSIADGVITTDAHGRITCMNKTAELLLGSNAADTNGIALENVFKIYQEDSRDPVDLSPSSSGSGTDDYPVSQSAVLVNHKQEEYSIRYSIAPIQDNSGHSKGSVVAFHDDTEMRALTDKLTFHAGHDSLTGLTNRRVFENRLEEVLKKTRHSEKVHGLLMMDLDRFKVVNDTCGHVVGDKLLKDLAEILKSKVRKDDMLARIGGDEFALLLENCTLTRSREIANILRQAIQDFIFRWEDRVFNVGVSIGLVELNRDTASVTDAIKEADTACYVAKDLGRNRVHQYGSKHNVSITREKEIEWLPRIRDAIDANRLCLYAQRIAPIANDLPEQAEILVRMLDDKGDIIPPGAFIPAAERYGLMRELDRWVVMSAFYEISQDRTGCRFSINLSGQSLSDESFLGFILSEIEASGVDPEFICFEITETCAIENLSNAMRLLSTLKGIGCRFALDDFGSGLSSFAYIKNLTVDTLKIDGRFIRNLQADRTNQAIAESIVQVASSMGFQTVAECVEDHETIEILQKIGVDYVQGFAIHRPAPIAELQQAFISEQAASA
jgi:diguanylate cyclase (GGDEF)-like protein/PAS domain S-box-containing protein